MTINITYRGMFLFIFLFISLLFPGNAATMESVESNNYQWNITDQPVESMVVRDNPSERVSQRRVDFPNQDVYWMQHIQFNRDNKKPFSYTIHIKGKKGTFKYFHQLAGKKELKSIPLKGSLPKTDGYICTSETNWFLSYPTVFVNLPNHCLKESSNSIPIKVSETSDGYNLSINFPRRKGTFGELWALQSTQQLVYWEKPSLIRVLSVVDLTNEGKWCWDGKYNLAPSSYYPGGKGVYWRFPDNYVARSFVVGGGSRVAYDLGWLMLHVAISNQNKLGYWETLPLSRWLWNDYKIGAGFYDSRFNTDFARLLLAGYKRYGDNSFLASAQKYLDWFHSYAAQYHVSITGQPKGQLEGWLVPDYYWPKKFKPTHTSLNHQLNEINLLYEFHLLNGTVKHKELADKLLFGIKNTKNFWLQPDGNLKYGFLNWKNVGVDYPYLTYDDLWKTQKLVLQIYGKPDKDLELLLSRKKQWMDKHGIKGYIK